MTMASPVSAVRTDVVVPAAEITVCAEWTQETIDANRMPNVPAAVKENAPKLMELIQSYDIEFFEIATKDKIKERA